MIDMDKSMGAIQVATCMMQMLRDVPPWISQELKKRILYKVVPHS